LPQLVAAVPQWSQLLSGASRTLEGAMGTLTELSLGGRPIVEKRQSGMLACACGALAFALTCPICNAFAHSLSLSHLHTRTDLHSLTHSHLQNTLAFSHQHQHRHQQAMRLCWACQSPSSPTPALLSSRSARRTTTARCVIQRPVGRSCCCHECRLLAVLCCVVLVHWAL
jgi:hypothetical protein